MRANIAILPQFLPFHIIFVLLCESFQRRRRRRGFDVCVEKKLKVWLVQWYVVKCFSAIRAIRVICAMAYGQVFSNTCIYSDHIPAVRNFNCSLCVVSFFKIRICLLLSAHCTVCKVREGCRASEAGLSVRYYLITGIDKSRETAGDAFFTRLNLSWETTIVFFPILITKSVLFTSMYQDRKDKQRKLQISIHRPIRIKLPLKDQ